MNHHNGKNGVAIIELSGGLKVGERIKVQSAHGEFEQAVDSMEVDHKSVSEARKGDVIGLKTPQKTSEGAKVYRL